MASPPPQKSSTDGRRQHGVRSPFSISRMRQANREGWCGTTDKARKARVGSGRRKTLCKQPGVQTPELEGTIPTTGTPSRAAGHVQTVGTTFQLFLSRAERGVSGLE